MNRINYPVTLLPIIIKLAIVFLCIYIVGRCVNIITGEKVTDVVVQGGKDTVEVLAKEIIDNTSIMNQYMLFVENHESISDAAKKRLLKAVVTDYFTNSEYTYDISDPGYEQVIDLLYKDISGGNRETATELPTVQPKKKKKKKEPKIIVPEPKAVGTVYTEKNIGTFNQVIEKFYTVAAATAIYSSDMPIDKAINENFKIAGNGKKPQILIYHTHSQEEFANSTSDASTTIIGVGDRLEKILREQFGYNVIHDESTYDIVNGRLDRNEAYEQARKGVDKILKKHPTISLVLDIHRDGVNSDTRLVTRINGKSTAQIMLLNGMSRFKTTGDIGYLHNPHLYENLALSLQMKLKAEAYYPGFTRRNYLNAYEYNLDVCAQCMLIEVGAQTNTYQEAVNAAEPLAMLIHKVMDEK